MLIFFGIVKIKDFFLWLFFLIQQCTMMGEKKRWERAGDERRHATKIPGRSSNPDVVVTVHGMFLHHISRNDGPDVYFPLRETLHAHYVYDLRCMYVQLRTL